LWIATATGLVTRKPNGDTLRLGTSAGPLDHDARLLVELPGDRMLVIGSDDTGHERVAFGKALALADLSRAARGDVGRCGPRTNGAVVMGGGRCTGSGSSIERGCVPSARDGMRLVPVTGEATSEWEIESDRSRGAPGATSLVAVADDQLLMDADLGTGAVPDLADGRAAARETGCAASRCSRTRRR